MAVSNPLINSEFSHLEIDYKSVLPGMDIVRVNPMLTDATTGGDQRLSAYNSGWMWNFDVHMSNPNNIEGTSTVTLHDIGKRVVLRNPLIPDNTPQDNYDRGLFYTLEFSDESASMATLVDLKSDITTTFKSVPTIWGNHRQYERIDTRTLRDGTTIAYKYDDTDQTYCNNLDIHHEASEEFITVERKILGNLDNLGGLGFVYTGVCVVENITLPDRVSKIVYQWKEPAAGPREYIIPRLEKVTYPDGNFRQYEYNDDDDVMVGIPKLSRVIDEEGKNEVSFDWEDRIVTRRYAGTSSDPQAVLAMEDNEGGTRTITDMEGVSRTMHFKEWINAAGVNFKRIAGLSDPCSWCGNDAKDIDYNDIGLVTKITSQRDVVTDIIRDNNDPMQREIRRVIGAGTPEERTIVTAYHADFNLPARTEVSDSSGSRVVTEADYDTKGRPTLVRVTNSVETLNGNQETVIKEVSLAYAEHSNGEVATLTINGPRPASEANDEVILNYSLEGLLVSETNHLGTTVYENYDGLGRAQRIIHPNDTTTERTFDWAGRILTSNTEGVITRYSYYQNGLLKSETTPGTEETTAYTYDDANRLRTVTDGLGNQREFSYDTAGRPVLVREGNQVAGIVSQSFTTQYNSVNNSVTRFPTDFSHQKQVSLFNEDFQFIGYTDELLKTVSLTRDALGRVKRTENNTSGLTNEAVFDASDNVQNSIYSGAEGSTRSQRFQYTSDDSAAVWELLDADTGTDTILRDLAGNVVDVSNSLGGNRVTSTYDPFDRITHSSILDPNTSQVLDTVDYHYDNNPDGSIPAPIGFLTKISGSLGEVKYFYDGKDNLIKKTQSHGNNSHSDSYSYDNAGRLLTMTYPSGRQVEFSLNAVGEPSAITTRVGNGAWKSVADQISYAPFADMADAKTLRYGSTQVATRLHDTAGRVQAYTDGGNTVSVEYRADNLVSTLSSAGTTLASYEYDASNQLKSASGVGFANQQFSFESTGDLKSITELGSSTRSLSYLNNTSRLSSFAGDNLSYTQRGLVSAQGDLNLTYNSRGLIATAKKGNGMVYQYGYDALGQRQSKTDGNGEVTHYHYDIAGRLIAESNPDTNETLVEYIWLGERPLMMIVPAQGTQAEAYYFIYSDYSNTPIRVTDAAGQTVWQWQRNPFGSNAPVIEQITFNLRMPGQYYDAETGLHYNGARYYNPATGRYLQPDPLGEVAGVSAYTYANGDPVNFIDPRGLQPIFVPIGDIVPISPPITVTAPGQIGFYDSILGFIGFGSGNVDFGGSGSFWRPDTSNPYLGSPTDGEPFLENNEKVSIFDFIDRDEEPIIIFGAAGISRAIINRSLSKKPASAITKDAGGALTRTFNLNGKQVPLVGRDPVVGRTLRNSLTEIKTSIRGSGNDAANLFRSLVGDSAKPLANGKGFRAVLDNGREVIFRPASSGRSGSIPKIEIRNPKFGTSEKINFIR